MMNQFSNEATSIVFDRIANSPELYEKAVKLAVYQPAKAPLEIRTWMTDIIKTSTPRFGEEIARDLVDVALRDVKWNEIRQALQREAAN